MANCMISVFEGGNIPLDKFRSDQGFEELLNLSLVLRSSCECNIPVETAAHGICDRSKHMLNTLVHVGA